MEWTELLVRGGIQEPPGRLDVLDDIATNPYLKPVKKAKKAKGKGGR